MKTDKTNACLGIIFGLLLTLVVGTLVDGWALFKIWNWFMPPLFRLTTLTLWQAMGVSMVFELFSRTNKMQKSNSGSDDKTMGKAIISALVKVIVPPILSVGIAWIILQFAF